MSPEATRGIVAALAAAALGMLVLQLVVLPAVASRYAAEAPEARDLVGPLWSLALAAGVFVQLALLVLARLVRRMRADLSLPSSERPWLAALAAASALTTGCVLVAHLLLMERGLGGPPPLMLAMLLCIVIGSAGTVAPLIARHRIARARAVTQLA